jgi:hypothetical protein
MVNWSVLQRQTIKHIACILHGRSTGCTSKPSNTWCKSSMDEALVGSRGWNCSGAAVGHAVLHQRGTETKKRPRAKKPWSVRCNSPLPRYCSCCSLGIKWNYMKMGAIASRELDPNPFWHNRCPCRAGRSCSKRELKGLNLDPESEEEWLDPFVGSKELLLIRDGKYTDWTYLKLHSSLYI